MLPLITNKVLVSYFGCSSRKLRDAAAHEKHYACCVTPFKLCALQTQDTTPPSTWDSRKGSTQFTWNVFTSSRKTGRSSLSNHHPLSCLTPNILSVWFISDPKQPCKTSMRVWIAEHKPTVHNACAPLGPCRGLQQCSSSMDNKPHMLLHQPIPTQRFQIRFWYCDFKMINYYQDGHLDHAHLRTDL